MTSLILTDNSGTNIKVRTSLDQMQGLNGLFQIMEIDIASTTSASIARAFTAAFSLQAFAVSDIINFAITNSLAVTACPTGNPESVQSSLNAPTLDIPASITLTPSGTTEIDAAWAAVSNATGYILERATNSGFTAGLTTIYSGPLLAFNDTGLAVSTAFWYRVHAVGTGFTSGGFRTGTATS